VSLYNPGDSTRQTQMLTSLQINA
jgi:hypothetical protein